MRLYRAKNYEDMSIKAASILAAQIVTDPNSVLGLATGSTPELMYRNLVEWYKKGYLDFSGVSTYNLDEYRGISGTNEQSYYAYMMKNLFSKVNIKEENTHIPDGFQEDTRKVCKEYEDAICQAGGIELQILGIGNNGHIGFNEPSDSFLEDCHCVNLAESTIQANKRFFEKEEDVPKQAYTMGVGTIMRAKKILLLASGKAKADAVEKLLNGPVTPQIPASILRLHPDVTIIADEEALVNVEEMKI